MLDSGSQNPVLPDVAAWLRKAKQCKTDKNSSRFAEHGINQSTWHPTGICTSINASSSNYQASICTIKTHHDHHKCVTSLCNTGILRHSLVGGSKESSTCEHLWASVSWKKKCVTRLPPILEHLAGPCRTLSDLAGPCLLPFWFIHLFSGCRDLSITPCVFTFTLWFCVCSVTFKTTVHPAKSACTARWPQLKNWKLEKFEKLQKLGQKYHKSKCGTAHGVQILGSSEFLTALCHTSAFNGATCTTFRRDSNVAIKSAATSLHHHVCVTNRFQWCYRCFCWESAGHHHVWVKPFDHSK